MSTLRPALVLIALFTLLTGVAFPLAFVGIGQMAFPFQANGSLLRTGDQVIGSALIGQDFTAPKYFHPRPSATTTADPQDASKTVPAPYAADASAASNLGPSSKALVERVQAAVTDMGTKPVPADAVTTSASGLDPDISPANAETQVVRIAAARGVPEAAVRTLLTQHTKGRLLGFIGEPRVNILQLNLALDQAH